MPCVLAVPSSRGLIIAGPREGGLSAAPFPWTPSPAHPPNLSRKENPPSNLTSSLRLILYWNQVAFSGSSCIGINP